MLAKWTMRRLLIKLRASDMWQGLESSLDADI